MAAQPPTDIRTYRDLAAWQKAMTLAQGTYRATETFPESERFGLVSQMRRSATSVAANVAEGFGRGRKAEFRRFLEVARGSLFELQTHAELARRLGWLKGTALTEVRDLSHEVDAILSGLIRSVKRRKA